MRMLGLSSARGPLVRVEVATGTLHQSGGKP